MMFLGVTEKPAGFVEPEPELFSRLAALVGHSEEMLDELGALGSDPQEMLSDLREVTVFLETKLAGKQDAKNALEAMSPEEMELLQRCIWLFMALQDEGSHREDDPAKFATLAVPKLKALIARLEKGEKIEDRVSFALKQTTLDIKPLWRKLGGLCRRLEALSHKQLRKVPFNQEENHFLTRYGEELAAVMLYGGNAYLTPKDDAPRIVDIFANPNDKERLLVGIDRPRAIYVLYPSQGEETLCRGAVLPYYEFRHPEPLTDSQWKELLDSTNRPSLPSWVKPIVAGGELSRSTLRNHLAPNDDAG